MPTKPSNEPALAPFESRLQGITPTVRFRMPALRDWLAEPTRHQPLAIARPWWLREVADVRSSQSPPPLFSDRAVTAAEVELGRQLFFDPRLSHRDLMACSNCHMPHLQFSSYLGEPGKFRNPPPILNRALSTQQFWDGRAATLEEQPYVPISSHHEMNTTPEECVARLAKVPGYQLQFERVYGQLGFEQVCAALATFQRMLVTGPSAWDYERFLRSFSERSSAETLAPGAQAFRDELVAGAMRRPFSDAARRGEQLFFSQRVGCSACHVGPNFSDEQFHNVGIGLNDKVVDLGRFAISRQDVDRYAFKTPTLRNVELTSPYMHNGQFYELADVVRWFAKGGNHAANPDIQIVPFHVSEQDVQDLVAFLKSLTGAIPAVSTDCLPE